MYYSVSAASWCGGAEWHLRVDIQPPSPGRERRRQMWRAARQRTEPARDWYLRHCERSEPCLKKCAHWFCCPLNKQRDISSQSFCRPALSSGFCRPLRHHSSRQCGSKAYTVLFGRDHRYISTCLLHGHYFARGLVSEVRSKRFQSTSTVDRICKTAHNLWRVTGNRFSLYFVVSNKFYSLVLFFFFADVVSISCSRFSVLALFGREAGMFLKWHKSQHTH